MSKKLGESVKIAAGIVPAVYAEGATLAPIVIDRLGYEDAVVLLNVGEASGEPTAQSVALKMQTGDVADGSDMADVSGDSIAALTADKAEAELNIDLAGYKRYVQAVPILDFTGGTTPAIPIAVTVALGNPRTIPV